MPAADATPGRAPQAADTDPQSSQAAPQGSGGKEGDNKVEATARQAAEVAALANGLPPIVAKMAGYASVKAVRIAGVLAVVMSMLLGMVLFGGGSIDRDAQYGTAELVQGGNDPRMSRDHLYAYQAAARAYNNPSYGGALPWTVIAAIAQLATEHGKVSPYADDTCDRAPNQPLVRQAATIDTESCEGSRSTFPNVSPPIGSVDTGEGRGPFLILPQALTGSMSDVDPNRIDHSGSGDDPRTATSYIAYELDRIRTDMIQKDGWVAPVKPNSEGKEPEEYATEFWTEAVSRLPIADPRNATCQTPQPGPASNEVSAAITATWRCELLRASKLHTYASVGDNLVEVSGAEAIDRIISEALTASWAHSALGAEDTDQALCGRIPLAGSVVFSGATNVTVIGDSLTEGIAGKIEPLLLQAGVPAAQVVVDYRRGRPTSEGVTRVRALAPTTGVVVAALGTNDSNPASFGAQIDAFMAAVPPTVKVLWLTIDKPGGDALNTELNAKAAAYANMVVADWNGLADANPAWLASDDIHLTGAGYTARAEFIVAQIPGGSSAAARPPLIGGREPTEDDEVWPTPADPNVPVGALPLTADMFAAFNPVPGASRCDLGPNIHAAVKAFIAGETVAVGDGGDTPATLGQRGLFAGPWNAMVGGWWAMPWVLGTDPERGAFLDNGPRKPFEATDACRTAITEWVGELAGNDAFATVTELNVTSVELGDLPGSPIGSDTCDNRTDGSVESLAAGIATAQRFALDTTAGAGTDPSIGDDGQDFAPDDVTATTIPNVISPTATTVAPATPPPTTVATTEGENPTTTVPEELDAEEQLRRNLFGIATWLNEQMLSTPNSVLGDPIPGRDVVIARFSPTGRSLTGVPVPGIAAIPYADNVVKVAIAFGGIIEDDSRFDPAGDPFEVAATASSVGYGGGFAAALAGVPAPLLDAVNRAVAQAPTLFPDCTIDTAFLLATARAESGPWWDRIGPDGTMTPALENQWTAMGPFQFIRITWPQYASDGDGDGDQDPQSTYDAALASLKFQCPLGQRYNGDLTDPETAWQVAVDYHDGPARNRETSEQCRASGQTQAGYGEISNSCRGERYGQLRVEYAAEYRAMIAEASLMGGGFYGTGGSVGERAVQYAMAQVGKLYCRDDFPNKCAVPFSSLQRQFTYNGSGLAPSSNPGSGIGRMGPDAFDCSGLVSAAYMMNGLDLRAYVSHEQFISLPSVPVTDLRPGDLLFYEWDNDGSRIDHVSMYVGGGMMVHAASHTTGVRFDPVNITRGFVGAARPALMPGAPL